MPKSRTHTIAMANKKGGCGKTTTTVNLAAACAEQGKRVCVIDIDGQCNLTTGLGVNVDQHIEDGRHTVLDIYLAKRRARDVAVPLMTPDKVERFEGRVRIVPGHRQLAYLKSQLDGELAAAMVRSDSSALDEDDIKTEQRLRLKHSIDSLRGECDLVLVDTPPDLGFLTTSALIAVDWLLIPVFPSGYDLDGLKHLITLRKKVAERYNAALNIIGVVLGNVDVKANLDNQIYDMLQNHFGEKLFDTQIRSAVKQRETTLYGESILEHDPLHPGSDQFRALAAELIERLDAVDTGAEIGAQLEEVNR